MRRLALARVVSAGGSQAAQIALVFQIYDTTGSGLWCDPWYCYSVGTGEYYDQFELSGRLSIKI